MDGAAEWPYLAIPLLVTVLAVVLASLFVKLRSSEGAGAAEGEGETQAPQGAPEAEAGSAAAAAAAASTAGGGGGGDADGEADGQGPPGRDEAAAVKGKEPPRVSPEGARAEEHKREGEDGEAPQEETERKAAAEVLEGATRSRIAEPASPPQQEGVPGQEAAAAAPSAPGTVEEQLEDEEEEEEEEDEEDDEDDEEESKEEDQESENEKLVVKEPETEDVTEKFFQYSPGKLRGNQYKAMMTKEELEEEQRTEDYMKLSLDSS